MERTATEVLITILEELTREMKSAYPAQTTGKITTSWTVCLTTAAYGRDEVTVCLINYGDEFAGCPSTFVRITEADTAQGSVNGIVYLTMKRIRREHAERRANWLGIEVEEEVAA